MSNEVLSRQLDFIIEIDKIKHIIRKTRLFDGSRFENDAEHSWHIALMAVVLREHASQPIDLERVITMLLVHDLVEIDAGDTFLYAPERKDAHAAELVAAQRIFGLLPAEEGDRLLALWEEFEARQTPDARFAAAMDRFEPLLQNRASNGSSWQEHRIPQEQVIAANVHIAEGAPALWDYALQFIEAAFARMTPSDHSKL